MLFWCRENQGVSTAERIPARADQPPVSGKASLMGDERGKPRTSKSANGVPPDTSFRKSRFKVAVVRYGLSIFSILKFVDGIDQPNASQDRT
jgi:hypothetical protein